MALQAVSPVPLSLPLKTVPNAPVPRGYDMHHARNIYDCIGVGVGVGYLF
jgi:hypothetical protein